MNEMLHFHNLSTIFISLIGAVLLLAIYFNIRKRFKKILEEEVAQKRVDKGLLNLGLAMLVWVAAGVWALAATYFGFTDQFVDQIGIHLLSTINNMFLLFALSYFSHAPEFIWNDKKNLRLILVVIVSVAIITLLLSYFGANLVVNGIKLIAIPDLILSGFICFLLLISLYRTFEHQGLKLVAIISAMMVALMFVSQLPQIFETVDNEFGYSLIRIVAKTSLISLFLLLATTWVIDLANTPRLNEMKIKFSDWSFVSLTIPSKNINHQSIDFGSKTTQYKNLLKLAIRRKYGKSDDQCILVNSAGEIKNQTYLSRVIENINQILSLSGEDKLDRRDLFTFLGESKYRLRILPEHIEIDESLLQEFIKKTENITYLELCNKL
ncbi:MAG: hypothetical protein AB8H03_17935 [Saprospiraceae bacterium]